MQGRVIALIAVLFAARGAAADSKKSLLDQGLRHYNTQDYKAAIAAWKKAYVLDPNPDTLFAIGQAQRLDGDCPNALASYRAVLRENVPAAQAVEVQRVIDVCEKVVSDAKPPPVAEPKPVEPTPVEPALVPEVAPPPAIAPAPSDTRRPWYTDKLGGALIGGGAVGLAVGTTFLILGGAAEEDANAATSYETFSSFAETARRDRTIGIIGLAAGGALVIGGIVRYATRSDDVEVAASISESGGSISFAGRF